MDTQLFKNRMNEFIPNLMTLDEIQNISKQSLSKLNCQTEGSHNLLICITEMAELSEQISKYLLNIPDEYHLLEEYADVQLSLYYIKDICQLSIELDDITNHKQSPLSSLLTWNEYHNGNTAILIECQLHLATLAHDLGDYLRNKLSEDSLISTMTYVQRALYYIQHICNLPRNKIHKAIHIKMERVQYNIITNGKHQ